MKSKKCVGFLPWLLLCALSLTPFFAQAVRSSGAWQELTEQTAAINGTPPQADSVTIPVYQGSVQLRSDAANPVDYSAKPSQFSTSDVGSALTLTNPHDTEGDIFAVPPLTAVNMHLDEVARQAITLLFAVLSGEKISYSDGIMPELVV
ncbi:hypothetical protein, partial [Salmonella enterica]|uniref:hypothetical protein n=1 Tax=Salmonella enterica TaxID=28901 RepID=UPI003C6EDF81